MTNTKLTLARFDAMMERAAPSRDKIIWTAEAIAKRLDCSSDFVRDKLATAPGSPIKKIGGRFCAHEGDLIAWLRG